MVKPTPEIACVNCGENLSGLSFGLEATRIGHREESLHDFCDEDCAAQFFRSVAALLAAGERDER